jgi:hypothetical protein
MREAVLRDLAVRAASDRAFLAGLRRDPHGTLKAHGYDLTKEELAAVLDLRRRTAALGDGTVSALLAGGLKGRDGASPGRPRPPGGTITGPATPGRPGSSGGLGGRRGIAE